MDRLAVFAERLDELMFERGETVKSLAEKEKLNSASLYSYLKGAHYPTVKSLLQIVGIFRCSADYLFGFTDEFTPKEYKTVAPICARLEEAFHSAKTTRYAFSKKTGIKQKDLYSWVRGKIVPSVPTLIVFAEFFSCSLDFLLGRE